MNVYKVSHWISHEGGGDIFLTHEQTYSDGELAEIINAAIEELTPVVLDQEKRLVHLMYDHEVELWSKPHKGITKRDRTKWLEDAKKQFEGEHPIRYSSFWYLMEEFLVTHKGFQKFSFTAVDLRDYDAHSVTFKLND